MRRLSRTIGSVVVMIAAIVLWPLATPASAAELTWPSNWTNPLTNTSRYQDWNFDVCGYVAGWAHLGADSQGESGTVTVHRQWSRSRRRRLHDDRYLDPLSRDRHRAPEHERTIPRHLRAHQLVDRSGCHGVAGSDHWRSGEHGLEHPLALLSHSRDLPPRYASRRGATVQQDPVNPGYANPVPWLTANSPKSSTPIPVSLNWVQYPGAANDVAMTTIRGGWEMFHVGTNNVIYRKTLRDGALSGWVAISGPRALRVAATQSSKSYGRAELFYIGLNHQVYHQWESSPGGTMSTWEGLGGYATEIAAARAGNGWEVFHVGGGNGIYRATNSHHGWMGLPGQAKRLAAATSRDLRVELFPHRHEQRRLPRLAVLPWLRIRRLGVDGRGGPVDRCLERRQRGVRALRHR